MAYVVTLKKDAQKELDRLPKKIHNLVLTRLENLKETPRPSGVKKLHGREGYRIRVGDYRILYTVDDPKRMVTIYSVGHRKDVYRI